MQARCVAKTSFCLLCVIFAGTVTSAGNPVPFVNDPLVPTGVAPGNGALTLTVNGGGFVSGATVNWNGTPLATTFVSNTKLTAAVPAADTQSAGSAEITVTNPGSGTASKMVQFLVAAPGSNVFYQNAPNSPYGNYLSPEGLWDFTSDGKLDLLVLSLVPQYSGLMPGAGDATFGALTAPLPTAYTAWFVGDFNDDGRLDLIAAPVSGSQQVFWGNDDGTFSLGPVVTAPAGWGLIGNQGSNGISGMSATDFNGDSELDLLLENAKTGQVQTLLGNGDGRFTAGPTAILPQGFDVEGSADFNGDGRPDDAPRTSCLGDNVRVSVRGVAGQWEWDLQSHCRLTCDCRCVRDSEPIGSRRLQWRRKARPRYSGWSEWRAYEQRRSG